MSAPTRRIIQNAVYIPEEGLWLKSSGAHDAVYHTLKDGMEVMVDGGREYIHRSVNPPDRVVWWDLFVDDPFEVIAGKLLWGTLGLDGKGPRRFVPLKDCALDHLCAIRDTQDHICGTIHEQVVLHWIAAKSENPKAA